jgi:energy-coupling factor transporter ATP-binding protein EcfA2
VSKIPLFDPTQLPYWHTYVKEGTADSIVVGGTIAGAHIAGLSGGQRKLLLLELVYQRTIVQTPMQTGLLIALDEPFSGVTDDFLPYILRRLRALSAVHNILIVTNDHIRALTEIADYTLTVSAVDHENVTVFHHKRIDGVEIDKNNARRHYKVNRWKAMASLSVGGQYDYNYKAYAGSSSASRSLTKDLKFFVDVEIKSNQFVKMTMFLLFAAFGLYVPLFWNSAMYSSVFLMIAGCSIAVITIQPYLFTLCDWRIALLEEKEALLHASPRSQMTLKFGMVILLFFLTSLFQWASINAIVDGFRSFDIYLAMLSENFSTTMPLACAGLFTTFSLETTLVLGSVLNMSMYILSTAYTPGGGLPIIKELRYLYPRFYFWCMLPDIQDRMEGCPDERLNLTLLLITGQIWWLTFVLIVLVVKLYNRSVQSKRSENLQRYSVRADNLNSKRLKESPLNARAYEEDDTEDGVHPNEYGKKHFMPFDWLSAEFRISSKASSRSSFRAPNNASSRASFRTPNDGSLSNSHVMSVGDSITEVSLRRSSLLQSVEFVLEHAAAIDEEPINIVDSVPSNRLSNRYQRRRSSRMAGVSLATGEYAKRSRADLASSNGSIESNALVDADDLADRTEHVHNGTSKTVGEDNIDIPLYDV